MFEEHESAELDFGRDKKGITWMCWIIRDEKQQLASKVVNTFDEERTNFIYVNKLILQLLRHAKFKLNDFHVWSKVKRTICHRISNFGIGWWKEVAKRCTGL